MVVVVIIMVMVMVVVEHFFPVCMLEGYSTARVWMLEENGEEEKKNVVHALYLEKEEEEPGPSGHLSAKTTYRMSHRTRRMNKKNDM